MCPCGCIGVCPCKSVRECICKCVCRRPCGGKSIGPCGRVGHRRRIYNFNGVNKPVISVSRHCNIKLSVIYRYTYGYVIRVVIAGCRVQVKIIYNGIVFRHYVKYPAACSAGCISPVRFAHLKRNHISAVRDVKFIFHREALLLY